MRLACRALVFFTAEVALAPGYYIYSRLGIVGQVPDLPKNVFRRARPGPQFGSLHQSGPHRIRFDVPHDPLKLLTVAHPVIIGFVLPKLQPGSTQDEIGFPRAGVLHCASYFPQRFVGLQQNMHVVRHNHPCEELVQTPFPACDEQRLCDRDGHVRMSQEGWPRIGRVQLPIQQEESSAFRERVGYHGVIGTRQGAI